MGAVREIWEMLSHRGRVLAVALVVALVVLGWGAYDATFGRIRTWDVDAQGPVLVSADGRTLTLPGVPDPAWNPEDCFTGPRVTLETDVHGSAVRIWFHLVQVERFNVPAGSCAQVTSIPVTLDRPLGSRTVTDRHGRVLPTVMESSLPYPRDPDRAEYTPESSFCMTSPQDRGFPCDGRAALVRRYTNHMQQQPWLLYQALGPNAPVPAPAWPVNPVVPRGGPVYGMVNGVPAVCGPGGEFYLEADWSWDGMPQRLLEPLSQLDRAGTLQLSSLCGVLFADAATVR